MDCSRDLRPFRWFLLSGLVAFYLVALATHARLQPRLWTAFTALMILHAALHLSAPTLVRRRWSWGYFVAQGLVIAGISFVTGPLFLGAALYVAVVGEAVLLVSRPRAVVSVVTGYIALFIVALCLDQRGSIPFVLVLIAPAALFGAGFVAMFMREAQARERAQILLRELQDAHHQLAASAAQVEALTIAAERQRLARELHDTLAQGLVGMVMQLEASNAHLARGNTARAQAIMQQTMERARGILADAREAIDDLRVSDAPHRDLCTMTHEEIRRFHDATGIVCSADLAPLATVPPSCCGHVLRIVSEGLTNIARHSRARHVWVRAARCGAAIEIEIGDDGVGFAPDAVPTATGHYGLEGMRERACLIGGRFDITSVPGEGTRICLHLPSACEGKAGTR